MEALDDSKTRSHPKAVRLLFFLVAITTVLSLLYGIQYYAGAPLHLAVVSEIYDLALSPDHSLIAAAAKDGRVRLWQVPAQLNTRLPAKFNVAEGEPWPVHTLSAHSGPVIEVAFSPDGLTLTSVSNDGEVRLWDVSAVLDAGVASGQLERKFDLGGGALNDVDLTPDCSLLAAVGEDGAVRVWDVTAGQEIQSTGPNENVGLAVAFNPDGTLVAAGDGANIQIWDARTGELVRRLEGYWEDPATQQEWLGHTKEVTTLAFSPDGQFLATGSADTTIVFWDLETGEARWSSEAPWATVTKMVFNREGNLVLSIGKDNKARTLRVAGGKTTATYEGHLSTLNGAAFGPQPDTILTAGNDGTLRLWETANQKIIHLEWSRYGLQPTWGKALGAWMLISGLLGLVCLWGLRRIRIWSHLLTLALYLVGPVVVLGLPLLETLSYPLLIGTKVQIAWPLIVLAAWYVVLLVTLMREPVALFYEAPHIGTLAEQLVTSRRTVKTRFGIFGLAVWFLILVVLFSVLRRFNLDVAFMGHFFSFIMAGSGLTIWVSAVSIALAVVLALLGAIGRLSKNPMANGASSFYVSLIRGTPLLVQIYIWYLGLPRLGVILPPVTAGILALGVNYGAYMTEIFRAGIQAIGKGQHEAAQALGMTRGQTLRRIVLPQAFRIVIPPIGNEFIAMMKDSSLVSVMSVWELTYRAQKIGRQNFRNMETFIIAAGFYWILTVVFQLLQGKLEEYMARSERR